MTTGKIIKEATAPVIAFCWGRFQPPHLGHAEVFKKLANTGTAGFYICTSQTQDKQKNPLDYSTKCQFIREIFPQYSQNVLEDTSVKTIYDAIVAIYNRMDPEEAKNTVLTFVGDPERCAQFGPGFAQYNGQQMKHGFYQFKAVTTLENTDAADIRATDVRAAAAAGDMAKFMELTGTKDQLADTIYEAVRRGMGVKDNQADSRFANSMPKAEKAKADKPKRDKKTVAKVLSESARLRESISGEDLLKLFHQTHHTPGETPEMEKYILAHDWGVRMLQPDQIPDEDDDVYYQDPFHRVIHLDKDHIRHNVDKIRNNKRIDPIIIGPKNSIIDGNHRAQAARILHTSIQAYVPMSKEDQPKEELLIPGKKLIKKLNPINHHSSSPAIKQLASKHRATLPEVHRAIAKGSRHEYEECGDIDRAHDRAISNLLANFRYYDELKEIDMPAYTAAAFKGGLVDRQVAYNPDDVGAHYTYNMDDPDYDHQYSILDEVSLKKIRSFADNPFLENVNLAWELEMIWPNHDDDRHDDDEDEYGETEPDYDADETIDNRGFDAFSTDVMNFFRGDYNSRGDVRDALDTIKEAYSEWLTEQWNNLDDEEKEEEYEGNETKYIDDKWDEEFQGWCENEGLENMTDLSRYQGIYLTWPHYTEPERYSTERGELTREDLRQQFVREFGTMLQQDGFKVVAWDHPSKDKEPDTWYFEPDGSLQPGDNEDGGVELTSPIIPYKRSLEYLDKIFAWAKRNGAYTGSDYATGMHLNLSLPEQDMDSVDWVKLILMGGDDRVLRDFDRWANGNFGWANSALKKMKDLAAAQQPLTPDTVINIISNELTPEARKEASNLISGDKYMSVHPKGKSPGGNFGYVEFRSAGGDTLANLDKVKTAALQYARSLYIASNPEVEKREYASKLIRLFAGNKNGDSGMDAFRDYAAGKIDIKNLKYRLIQRAKARGQEPKATVSGHEYGLTNKETKDKISVVADSLTDAVPQMYRQALDKNPNNIAMNQWRVDLQGDEEVYRVHGGRPGGDGGEFRLVVIADNEKEAIDAAKKRLGADLEYNARAVYLPDLGDLWSLLTNGRQDRNPAERAAARAAAAPPKTMGPIINLKTGQPRPAFTEPQAPQAVAPAQPARPTAGPGTYIINYLPPQGNQQKTAYDANSEEEAVSLFHVQHPASYRLLDVTRHEETPQSESLFNTLMGKSSVIDEEEVDEVNMSPGALADFAKTDAAKRIRVGWEAEMLVPDMSDPEPQWDDDTEPNWDENRSIRFDFNWRNQIQDFWRDGDYNSESRRSIERAIEEMDEQYGEHVSDQFADYLDSEEGIAALMASIRENEAGTEDLSDEEISELDDYANFMESARDDLSDRWTSEYMADDSNFVDWAEDNSLGDMIGFANRFNLSWPYQTPVSKGGSVNMESLSKEFSKFSGYPTKVGSYSTRPDDQTGVFKTDSSIKLLDLPDNYSGVEFASAYLPYDESVDMLNKFYKWAGEIGAETNESCGFHMGISIPDQNSSNVDVLKFVLFLGDNKVLKDFGREASTWTKSTIDKMNFMSLAGGDKYEAALAAMKQGLNAAATAQIKNTALPVSSDRGGDRYMSVNYKSDYIEVRSAGGNVFEMKDKILETMNRYVRVLALAADPEAEKQEYAKKLYKLLSSSSSIKGNDDTIRYFSQYAAGTLPSKALKSFVRQTQSQRKRDREIKAATAPATGLHGASNWTVYKILRRADDFEVHEFLATDANQAQETLERWARAGGMDSENYTVVRANQQPNQQSQDDDIDFGTWEPEPEPQRPTGPNTWSPNARIAYQLLDRTGRAIAYFTDGTRMPTNSIFYAANSDDAGRRAADLDRVHGLPMGYIVRPFGRNESTEPRSLYQSNIARAVLAEEEEIVDEVVMNPSAFQAFLGTEAAQRMTMGFEAEMCVKNLATGSVTLRPRMPPEEEMAIPYPFDEAGRAKYYDFWSQNNANTRRSITYGMKRLEDRMKSWMNSHAAGEEITSDHWARFLRGGGYRNWTNQYQLNDVLELKWPYGNDSGRMSVEDLRNDFQNSTGFGAVIFRSYHGGDKPKDKFVFEPDSSIRPKAGDGAQELVSFAMPLPQAIDALDKMFAWANEKGYVYANGSTGFHVNVGMEGNTPDKIDTLKLLMLMGDQKILQEFGRESNTYCESMMGRVMRQLKGGYTGQSGRDELLQSIKTKTWDGLRRLASRFVDRAQSGDKFVSVNNKGKYIEFRGPGGDWMSQQAKMRNTILQVSRAYAMAADPAEGQQDYLKKVYKLLSGMDENKKDDRLQVFADWSMGKISNEALANQLRARQGKPTQAATAPTAQPTSTNTPNTQPARRVVDTGEYSENILASLHPELVNAQSWTLIDENGDEYDSFTATAREAISMGMDQSESYPEYTYSLESDRNGQTFATFSSGGSVYYAPWVIYAARQNPAAASPAAAAPTAQATNDEEEPAVSNMWDVWFMHQDPDDEEPSEISNRVRADSAQAAIASWNQRYPRSPVLRVTPSEGMTEAKLLDVLVAEESKRSKPKKPKTIVDGALKTLISKGRSEDEAIADLKKEIDRKFYTEGTKLDINDILANSKSVPPEIEDLKQFCLTESGGVDYCSYIPLLEEAFVQQGLSESADRQQDIDYIQDLRHRAVRPRIGESYSLMISLYSGYDSIYVGGMRHPQQLSSVEKGVYHFADGTAYPSKHSSGTAVEILLLPPDGFDEALSYLRLRFSNITLDDRIKKELNQEISETLKRVKGKWALVSRQDPKKVLQYYHGSGHPSKEWVSKVERRVHSFSEDQLDEAMWLRNIFPDGPIQLRNHMFDRKDRIDHAKITTAQISNLLMDIAKQHGKAIAELEPTNFYVNYKDGLGLGVSKMEKDDGSFYYRANTAHPFWFTPHQLGFTIGRKINESKAQKPKVFVDMDGVLADFFGEWAKLDGKKHWKDFAHIEDALDLIRKHPTFWTSLPLLPHAKELIKFVNDTFGEYRILSKPLEKDPLSSPGKRAWIQEHFQDLPPRDVILTADKAAHAMSGDVANILIDDYPTNIDSWREAGGIGILYEPAKFDKVKKILKGLLYDDDD
jgi:5'(3')-deoxyribonucleotidase